MINSTNFILMQNTIQKQDLTSPFAKTNAIIKELSAEPSDLDHLDIVKYFKLKDEDEFEGPELTPLITNVQEEEN